MITAGVDVGLKDTKLLILKDGDVVARASAPSLGAGRKAVCEELWRQALAEAGIAASDVQGVVSTGQGKEDVDFAGATAVEAVAAARAARFLFPSSETAVDAGADQTRVVTLGEAEAIEEVVFNQKCAAGLGILIDAAADRLGMGIDEVSALPDGASGGVSVNDGCPVFAEEGLLELLNDGVEPAKIAGAIIDMAAVRLNAILNDKAPPSKAGTVLMGGLARNAALARALVKRSGVEFLVPEAPEYGGALGCAVIAAGRGAAGIA